MAKWVTLVLEYGARASRCNICQDGIARDKLRAVKGEKSAKQLVHPSCFFDWLCYQLRADLVSKVNESAWEFHDSLEASGPQGLKGFTDLQPEEQTEVGQLVAEHLAKVRQAQVNLRGPATNDVPAKGPPAPQGQVLVISSDEDDDNQPLVKVPRLHVNAKDVGQDKKEGSTSAAKSPVRKEEGSTSAAPTPPRKLPNMLEGVKIPEGAERTGDECSVCLDPPVHPVSLPCGHIFCYLCAKGLGSGHGASKLCSNCRRPIPVGYLESAEVLSKASQELSDTPPLDAADQQWQWFYEGRNGWWRFESRNNEELEEAFSRGQQQVETMICGNIYIINLVSMEQYQKTMPQRKRRIKRDLKSAQCKGVAGLGKHTWQ